MKTAGKLLAAALCAAGLAANAATDQERIAALEKKVEVLSREVEKKSLGDVIQEPGESKFGLSPSASKVYQVNQGISLGGYGEVLYQNFDGSKADDLDMLRAILYVGYKYNDKLVLNTEFEFEHATTDQEGSVSVEFAYIDYLHSPAFNLRGGLVLIPVGLVSELHEPTTFLSARRPDIENRIIPSTWRENGVGVFGEVAGFNYKAYLVNGFDAEGFTDAGVRGGRQKGSNTKADDFAFVGRLDYTAIPGLIVGGSAYYGDSGQDLGVAVNTFIYEGHIDWKWKGLDFRALAVAAELEDVAELNSILATAKEVDLADFASVGEEMQGWYVQLGYDVLNLIRPGEASLTPYVRVEQFNTQDKVPSGFTAAGKNDVESLTVGLNYKPIDQVVLKAEFQDYDNKAGTAVDQWNIALGYIF